MKKLLALLLTLAMTLSLAACGSNGDSSTECPRKSTGAAILKIDVFTT